MKIVSWNCGGWSCGGFNVERYKKMMQYNPEILLIQECTKKEFDSVSDECKLDVYYPSLVGDDLKGNKEFSFLVDEHKLNEYSVIAVQDGVSRSNFNNYVNSKLRHWYGDTNEESYKGIAIFSTTYNVELIDNFNKEFRFIVPYKISSIHNHLFKDIEKQKEYIILSVWTKQPSDGSWDYQKTIFEALEYYNFDIPIILIGDFNTGSNKNNIHRYEELKIRLEKYGLKNCAVNTEYEYEPTFYHDKTNNYFTNDFCFISKEFNVYEFCVDKMNNQKRWHGFSDHCPIIADFGELTLNHVKEIKQKFNELGGNEKKANGI